MIGRFDIQVSKQRRSNIRLRNGIFNHSRFNSRPVKNQRNPRKTVKNLAEFFCQKGLFVVQKRMVSRENKQRIFSTCSFFNFIQNNPKRAIHIGGRFQIRFVKVFRFRPHIGRQIKCRMHAATHPMEEQRLIGRSLAIQFDKALGESHIIFVFCFVLVKLEPFLEPNQAIIKIRFRTNQDFRVISRVGKDF